MASLRDSEAYQEVLFAIETFGGGRLHAVIPCHSYADTVGDEAARQTFQHLLSAAYIVTKLPFSKPSEEAFMAAGCMVAHQCDLLLTV